MTEMISEWLQKLWTTGILQLGIWETVYMTLISTALAYLIGLPLGLLLCVSDKNGVHPIPWLNRILGVIVNAFRSVPFVILMVAMLPVAKILAGTSLGNRAVIVTLVIAAAPYVARMVEGSVKEVDPGVIEAAKAMGTPNFQIVWRVLLPEAKPALINGSVISTVTILGYSAMAGTIGGGGLGQIAITYGYQKYENDVIWVCVLLTILLVQLMQEVGTWIARRTDKRIRE
jgi:D-methionine transport system permease protein